MHVKIHIKGIMHDISGTDFDESFIHLILLILSSIQYTVDVKIAECFFLLLKKLYF